MREREEVRDEKKRGEFFLLFELRFFFSRSDPNPEKKKEKKTLSHSPRRHALHALDLRHALSHARQDLALDDLPSLGALDDAAELRHLALELGGGGHGGAALWSRRREKKEIR